MVLLNSSFDEIDYDESAVITNRILGTTQVKQSGAFVIKFPWSEVQIYKVTQDLLEQTLQVTDKENKSFKMTVSVRFFPKRDQIDKLHKNYGKNYKSLVLDSLAVVAIRVVAKKYTAIEIYSDKRAEVEIALAGKLKELFENNFIHFDSSLIRSVELPEDKIKKQI